MTSIRPYEAEEIVGRLLPSQRAGIFAPESMVVWAAGVGAGKTHAGITKGLILSSIYPGNRGMCLSFRGTDIEDRLLPLFEQICPSSWIKTMRKKPSPTYVLRNNSTIGFRHLHDAHSSTKTGRLGANLGWFFITQLEECEERHWDAMLGRLRNPYAKRKFAFADCNPNGRDWIWSRFFQGVKPFPKDEFGHALPLDGKLYQLLRPHKDVLGIAVDSEENRQSNGGFVEDSFYDRMLDNYGEAYVNRYVHCSFDDFKGKLFPDYEAGLVDISTASVHNIEPFKIPNHWLCKIGIDVGGDSPWAVTPIYSDEEGNLIITRGFDRRTGRVAEVSDWIKRNTPWNQSRTTFVIDPENKIASQELLDYGIACHVAQKEVNPGLLRMEGYFHVNKKRSLPRWYEETQPPPQFYRFREKGSPKIFVFNDALTWRKEHDTAKWDAEKSDKMFKSSTARYDQVEATRYVVMEVPQLSGPPPDDKYAKLEAADPMKAREARAWDRRLAELEQKGRGGTGGKLVSCEEYEDGSEMDLVGRSGDDF